MTEKMWELLVILPYFGGVIGYAFCRFTGRPH